MAFIAGAIIGGGISAVGGLASSAIGSSAAGSAADKQAEASKYAADLQKQEFDQQQANQKPWLDAGKAALPQLSQLASTAPSFTKQDFYNNEDPGYQFNLDQGLQAIQRSAAARGGLQSGGTLKALSGYAQGQASNEYNNAYNRFMNNQNTQFNRLSSLAGVGQTANSQLNAAGENYANNVGNIATSNASAQGAAGIAGANAWGNTLSSLGSGVGNTWMQYSMMNKMFPGSSGGGGGAGFPYAGQALPSVTAGQSYDTLSGLA